MNKYESLMNKKINLEFNGVASNSFQIKEMTPTDKKIKGFEGRGNVYDCKVEWEKKMPGAPDHQVMGFDDQTLKELLDTKTTACPGLQALSYRME